MIALSDPAPSPDSGALCYSLKVRAVACVCDPLSAAAVNAGALFIRPRAAKMF